MHPHNLSTTLWITMWIMWKTYSHKDSLFLPIHISCISFCIVGSKEKLFSPFLTVGFYKKVWTTLIKCYIISLDKEVKAIRPRLQ